MINAIFACSFGGGLGNKGSIPWKLDKRDMAWFKEKTLNQIVVMGKNTWNDPKMPKPLPDRICYVVTSEDMPRVNTISGDIIDDIIQLEKEYPDKEIFIIGGKQLLEECRPIIDNVYLTYIKQTHWCDTRMDLNRYLDGFRISTVIPTENNELTFTVYKRMDLTVI